MFMALPFRYSQRVPSFCMPRTASQRSCAGLTRASMMSGSKQSSTVVLVAWIAGSSPAMTDERQKIQNPSHPVLVERRRDAAAVQFQGALLADRVRALEDPVLPGGQPSEDLGLHRLGAGEAQIR